LLAELGYEADVSVRPLHDYRSEGGPDFSAVEPLPYRAAGGAILEVPLTAAYIGRLRRLGPRLYPKLGGLGAARSLLARTGLLSRIALTPEGMPVGEAKEAVDRLLGDGVRLFSISFHSPSVEPGHTPYVRSAADLDRFHAWWDEMFAYLARRGVAPATMEEILEAGRRGRGLARTRRLG
jgi:hypothetical protein